MKKLFFAALVATVAVGGALSVNAETYYQENQSTPIVCETGEATCLSALGAGNIYRIPASEGDQGSVVNPLEYEDLEFQP